MIDALCIAQRTLAGAVVILSCGMLALCLIYGLVWLCDEVDFRELVGRLATILWILFFVGAFFFVAYSLGCEMLGKGTC